MSAYFISDLHLGHKNVLKFSPSRQGACIEEHDEILIDKWNTIVSKRDTCYVLGDVAWTRIALQKASRLKGNKHLITGNHDLFRLEEYAVYFKVRPGILKYKGMWLSHAPIHPLELRGKLNVHGHVHTETVPDSRYLNVCVEALNGYPISLEEINEKYRNK